MKDPGFLVDSTQVVLNTVIANPGFKIKILVIIINLFCFFFSVCHLHSNRRRRRAIQPLFS